MPSLKRWIRKAPPGNSTGKIKSFFYIFAILVSLYHLYTAIFGPPVTLVHRSLHVAMMCSMCFLMYPMRKKIQPDQTQLV